MNIFYILTDLINALPGNGSVNTYQQATIDETVYSMWSAPRNNTVEVFSVWSALRNGVIKLISSFLSQRKFRVSEEGEMSTPREMRAGVPLGSDLSHTLYNMYINDPHKHLVFT
jgi:hypothetical protein